MYRCFLRWLPMFVVGLTAVASVGPGRAQTIGTEVVDQGGRKETIRVVVPGRVEVTFSKTKGFGASLFDLAHDPEKKRNLAPVADENGLYWVKMARTPADPKTTDVGSWYANPARTMELLEAGPVRARVRLTGWHMRYGRSDEPAAMKDLPFELTHTVYPSGAVYTSYVLDAAEELPLHHFLTIIKSTGAWGPSGKGDGKGEAHCVSEGGDGAPRGIKAPASFVLQWSNGPTHFMDILLAYPKGAFGPTYWDEGYQDQDYRAGLNVAGMFPGNKLPKGKTTVGFLMRLADDMNSAADAAPYAADYRSPDKLEVTKGSIVTTDAGDLNADGFNEAEGCYVLSAAPDGIAFELHGRQTARFYPAFKVLQWKGGAPKSLTAGDKALAAGKDVNASASEGILLLQVLSVFRDDVKITVPPAGVPAAEAGR